MGMIRILAALFAGIALVVIGVLAIRALEVPPLPEIVAAPPPATIDSMDVARRLATAIRFQTVSYGGGVKEDEKNAALDQMRAWMERTYPNFHDAAGPEVFG